jgi:hypothetical protein
MGLSKHEGGASSIMKELELLDEDLIMLDSQRIKASQCFRLSGNPPKVIYNTNCPDYLKQKIAAILLKYRSSESAISWFYTVEFDFEDTHYTGRLTPEFKKGHDNPSSWHTVLNDVFFGHLNKDNNHWEISEQRPARLVEKVGSLIDSKAYQPHSL